MLEIIKNDIKLYGFRVAIGRILKHFHIISEYEFYGMEVKYYYSKLKEEQYHDELLKWLDILGIHDDIDNPGNFNEKIHYLKLHDNSPLKETLSDKFAVREWIADNLGEQYLIPLVGVWDDVKDIDFDSLPQAFCLKANHGSNMNIVVKDKSTLDIKKTIKTLSDWNRYNFGWEGFELQYVHLPRKIMAEKFIEQMDGNLLDYKIHCFHGEPKIIQVIGDRNPGAHTGKEAFFDVNWMRNDMMYHTYDQYETDPKRPDTLEEMLSIARKLSKNFRYVRVDLYEIEGQIKFGEMTFTPTNGIGYWPNKEAYVEVGSWI